MSSMQNRLGPVALPDIRMGSGVLMSEDLHSPQSNGEFQNLLNMNSPSELSQPLEMMRPGTFH